MTRSASVAPRSKLRFAVPLAALALLAAMTPDKTFAATPFDGYWNVSIMTQSGTCDRSYSFAVSIVDGRLDGANGALLGTVSSNGGVNVLMGGGDRRGSASGRLAGNSGSGRWSGSATGAACSGRWTAQRG